jgi:hypothetical protein
MLATRLWCAYYCHAHAHPSHSRVAPSGSLSQEDTCHGRQRNNGGKHSITGCDEAEDGWKPKLVYNTQDDDRWRKPLEDVRNSNRC